MKYEAVYEKLEKICTILFYVMVGLMVGGILMAAFAAYVLSLTMIGLSIVVYVANDKVSQYWLELIREENKEKR